MPKLVLIAACEKVITAQDGGASLINIFHSLKVSVRGEGATHVPMNWSIFTVWRRAPDDVATAFEQECALVAPDGSDVARWTIPLDLEREFRRNTLNIGEFPLLPAGEYPIKIEAREAGAGHPLVEYGRYPLLIVRDVVANT